MQDNERLSLQHKLWNSLNQKLMHVLIVQMEQLGDVGTMAGASHCNSYPGVLPAYQRWMDHTLRILQRNPQLVEFERSNIWSDWEEHKERWITQPEMRARVELADVMIRALPDIVTGKQSATEIMFPGGSMSRVEGIYKQNSIADYFNALLAAEAAQVIRAFSEHGNRKIRILEIGAGTGGTSSMLFQKFEPYRELIQEYCYTDVSKSFLQHARKQYGPYYPYLTYSLLNIEEPLHSQGVEAGRYDLVVATNVLHATRQIRHTLRNAKALLTLNGKLLINEIIEDSLFNHVTFGLLAGWWLFEDEQVRIPGTPLLHPDQWKAALELEGYFDIEFPASNAEGLGQQIISAASDGIVRQKHTFSSANQMLPAAGKEEPPKPQETITVQELEPALNALSLKAPAVDDRELKQACRMYLQKMIGAILDVEPEQIDPAEALEMYGLDSILIIQLTEQLNKEMGEHVSSVLFFEYTTLDALVNHFVEKRKFELISMLGLTEMQEESITEPELEIGAFSAEAATHLTESYKQQRPSEATDEVAIIGLAGRYAQADDMAEFWNNLMQGKNCITEIPSQRWDWRTHYHSEKGQKGTSYSRWGGFIRGIYHFDPLFFHISPKEAEQMDPQERQFLQTVYVAIEDAGYTPQALADAGTVGVYAGVMNGNYPTGASFWSIANRVSYTFNFTGPSLAVDTACSSSLTAIHLAMESLRNGTCDLAIAGGVNLIVDPVHYVRLSEKTMLTPDNECSPFGEGANGFVDGEGVGALLLKPLHLAEADGDVIYGIVKGSMINVAGRTKGYTVPNPGQQAKVISEAISRSGVDARTISYIEAHGTGTSLGDPIEIEGLRRAFEKHTADRQFCAIGSVKSNIGHAESAAGIAGVSKILLQMRHGCLVPSLHAESSNPNIRFSQTPFHVQQHMTPWIRPVLDTPEGMREYPRIAGISSFGAGGANAHVILEEYRTDNKMDQKSMMAGDSNAPVMIVLSAKTKDRLSIKVRQLAQAVQDNAYTDLHLARIAYTLQTGREEMECRCAFTAYTIKEMVSKLQAYLTGETAHEQIFTGEIDIERNDNRLVDDDDMQELAASWMRKRKTVRLLEQWVRGMKLDWQQWYGTAKPQRISLPGYPFAEEHHMIPSLSSSSSGNEGFENTNVVARSQTEWLHPLLHKNTSYLGSQRFSSRFTGNESFLRDHQVRGVSILPGAAHLEMAAAALRHSLPPEEHNREHNGNDHIRLHDLVWLHPASVEDQPLSVHLELQAERHQQGYRFEITSNTKAEAPSVLCSQGFVSLIRSTGDTPVFQPADWHKRHGNKIVPPERGYQIFSRIGLLYGSTHRCISHLYTGQHSVMARLAMPLSGTESLEEYGLHPSMLDSAFQACLALAMDLSQLSQEEALSPEPWLPYALQQAEIYRPCSSVMWVEVRYTAGSRPGHSMPRYDLALYSDDGLLCAKFEGLALRKWAATPQSQQDWSSEEAGLTKQLGDHLNNLHALEPWTQDLTMSAAAATAENNAKLAVLTTVWAPLEQQSANEGVPSTEVFSAEKLLILCQNADMNIRCPRGDAFRQITFPRQASVAQMVDMLAAEGDCDHMIWYCRPGMSENRMTETNREEQESFVPELTRFFRFVKSLLHLGYGSRSLHLTVVTTNAQALSFDDTVDPDQAAIHGLTGSLAKEYAHWAIRVIDLNGGEILPMDAIADLTPDPHGNAYVWRDQEWYRQELVPVEYDSVPLAAYRQGGVYLVIGGAGGIGEVWTRYMIATYNAQVIWLGRSLMSPEIRHKIEQLGQLGPEPLYIQADASLPGRLEQAYESVIKRFGQVNGIIHSALVLSDRSLARMDEEIFNNVLSAKVQISEQVNALMSRLRKQPDFVLFFSSLNSFMKLPGQGNYVAACCYADALASQMNRKWPGRIKVVNWGYWGSVGSVVSEQVRQSMQQKGIGSIEAEEAHPILEWLMSGSLQQAVILKMTRKPEMLVLNENQMLTVYR
ncbi:type I polyketide synthase [Paenibacillus xylanexedens]|uniref:Polyketide synthase PksM n=1 Tax=Paenibacillus xylanexedens TaxID=528191 RepID=A0ABS4RWI0_PAEXY|nr:type I polyketide synthase [Paenibacillus xylanexedens]MBP2247258.1 polyketide synthase PksM [Paenibacillus xylanexedens]